MRICVYPFRALCEMCWGNAMHLLVVVGVVVVTVQNISRSSVRRPSINQNVTGEVLYWMIELSVCVCVCGQHHDLCDCFPIAFHFIIDLKSPETAFGIIWWRWSRTCINSCWLCCWNSQTGVNILKRLLSIRDIRLQLSHLIAVEFTTRQRVQCELLSVCNGWYDHCNEHLIALNKVSIVLCSSVRYHTSL